MTNVLSSYLYFLTPDKLLTPSISCKLGHTHTAMHPCTHQPKLVRAHWVSYDPWQWGEDTVAIGSLIALSLQKTSNRIWSQKLRQSFSKPRDETRVSPVLWHLWHCRKKKVASQLKTRKRDYKKSNDNLRHWQAQMERVRSERARLFTNCFEHISSEIDSIYKVHVLQTVAPPIHA